MEFFGLLWILLSLALVIFWMYIAIQVVKALRQISSTLRRVAASHEHLEKHLETIALKDRS